MCVIQGSLDFHLTECRSPSFNQHQFITGGLFGTQHDFREFNLSLQFFQGSLQRRNFRLRQCNELLLILFDRLFRRIIHRFKACQRVCWKFCLLHIQVYLLSGFRYRDKEYFGRNTIHNHRIVFRLPLFFVVSFRAAIKTYHITSIFQFLNICRLKVSPRFQRFFFFRIAL